MREEGKYGERGGEKERKRRTEHRKRREVERDNKKKSNKYRYKIE
jgi:hypothetical protein